MRYLILLMLFLAHPVFAGSPSVYEKSVSGNMDTVYHSVYKSLEDNGFYVVFEPDIGKNLSNFADKWGKDYNRNKLESIRSMVFCNGWYANLMSNADPSMLSLCPLHVTLIQKSGKTTVLFVKPTSVAKGSKAEKVAQELESEVIKAIESGLNVK